MMATAEILSRLAGISLVVGTVFFLYSIAVAVRDIYFHPLSNVPGPKLWIAFPFAKVIESVRGTSDEKIRAYHGIYGPILRTGPKEISFITAEAWNDIYGHRQNLCMPKASGPEPGAPPNIINATPENHARIRMLVINGFSDRALRDQEELIQGYVDMLIDALRKSARNKTSVNIVDYMVFLTFDVIGDLSFGAPFNGLRDLQTHGWISNLVKFIEGVPIVRGVGQYPAIMFLFKKLGLTKRAMQARYDLFKFGSDTVQARMNDKKLQSRSDFITAMTQHANTPDEIPYPQIVANSLIFIMAGSETTATLLAGLIYWLLRTPSALQRVQHEVRTAFASPLDITIAHTADPTRCPYLLACIDEALRIYPPSTTAFFRRTTLPSTPICGINVPQGTNVGVHHSAAYWSPLNFTRPREFLPERFLRAAREDPNSEFYGDNREVFQPFSYGPRNCVGKNLALAEIRLAVAKVLWGFEMGVDEGRMGGEDGFRGWESQRSFLVWRKGELWVRFWERED